MIFNTYGPGVTQTEVKMGNLTAVHVVRSKSTDTANWVGGSTEAYVFASTLGEGIFLEANYSTAEPSTDIPLAAVLKTAASNMSLSAF